MLAGGEYKWKRAKIKKDPDIYHVPMRSVKCGRDYTPLYRFLMSKEGYNFDEVYSEAVSRVDNKMRIFDIIKTASAFPVVRIGDGTYYHTMYIDKDKILKFVDKSFSIQKYFNNGKQENN